MFIDPERFGDDEQEDMYKKYKLGWFYENAILENKPLRDTKNKEKIRKYYDEHHKSLNKMTKEKIDKYGKCTIIDCHSFSNNRYWFLDKNFELPDICIGFEDNHVDKDLLEIIKEEFKQYNTQINSPYQGSLVPTDYYNKDTRVKSVMIEINKKLYLEDDNITKNENFDKIKQKIGNIHFKINMLS